MQQVQVCVLCNSSLQTKVQLSVTHGFWLVQVREKLLELYKTVASVMPAASKER